MAQDARVVRKYRKEFESEFSWVKRNPDGSESAFCDHCEVSITPTSSCLTTHEASARHQKNVYDIKTTGQKTPAKPKEEGPKPSVWKKDYDKTRRFRDEWLEKFPWVRKDPDDDNSRFGYCPYCKIKLEPKAKRLEDHEHTVKHIRNIGGKVSGKIRAFGKKKKKFAGRRGKVRKIKVEKPPPTADDEMTLGNEFDKIQDISELMEELPTLLEEEDDDNDESNAKQSTSGDDGKTTLPPRKRGRPRREIKEEHEETDEDHAEFGLSEAKQEAEIMGDEYVVVSSEEHPVDDVTGLSQEEGQHVASTSSGEFDPANPWSSKYPWVTLDPDDGSLPYCKFCEVFIDPEDSKLEKHAASRKHIQNEIGSEEWQKSVQAARKQISPSKSDQRLKNPPTKRVQALESKKAAVVSTSKSREPSSSEQELSGAAADQQDLSGVQIVESMPVQINLVIPDDQIESGNESHEQQQETVNLTDYILLTQQDDQEMQLHQGIQVQEHVQDEEAFNDSIEAEEKANKQRKKYARRSPGEAKPSGWRREYEKSRRFQPEWQIDHPWVRRETGKNGDIAFCPYCNIDLEPRVVRLRQHEKTSKHRKNEEEHSKRVMEEEEGYYQQQTFEPVLNHPVKQEAEKKYVPPSTKAEVRPRYKCDLCSLRFVAQRNLFFHLKDHYEPGSKDTTAAQNETVLDDDEEQPQQPRPETRYEYKPAWERIFPWLQKAVDDDWAYCSLCKFPMEPKLAIIKAHLKHRRHVKLVSQQENPALFEPKPDTFGILAEDDRKEIRRKTSIIGNADIVTDEDGRQKYQCKICKKVLVKTSFAVHLRIHQGVRPFQCTMCEWAFKQAYDLKHHVESIHNNIKAHQCELCGKEFTRKYTLRLHQKSHTDVRDFKCSTCQRGFFTRGKLIEHERTHTGEKPFLCDFCGRGFRIKYDMVQHRLKTHYGVPAKRRKNPGNKMLPPQTTTTTYITTKDGTMIEDQGEMMTVEDSVEVEMEEHTVHTVHTIDGVMHEPKHQIVFISENEAVFLTK